MSAASAILRAAGRPGTRSSPQEIVLAFHQEGEALIHAVVIDTATYSAAVEGRVDNLPKHVEIWVSTTGATAGFAKIAGARLQPRPAQYLIRLPPTQAKYLKVRLLSNHGGDATTAAEVRVLEAGDDAASILRDVPKNLALPTLGGVVVRFTSALPDTKLDQPKAGLGRSRRQGRGGGRVPDTKLDQPKVDQLVDGSPAREGWRSTDGYLPQEFVFAFAGDQVRPSERLNLIRFSSPRMHKLPDVEVLLPGFTSNRAQLKAATARKFFADGATPLYDAIGKAIELLEGVEGNRAIVVMTDGADSSSRLGHPGFWRLLQEKRIRLYTIGLGFDLHAYQPTFASTGERILKHAALATNGRFFFARTAEELHGVYQQIADELRTVSSYDVRPTLSRGTGSLDVVATGERIPNLAPPQLELMLDASGSMNEKLKRKGPRKIDIAKEAMVQIIEGLPDGLPVALRVFGHRIRERQPGDCQDSELVVPFAPLDKPRLLDQVRAIQALGTTPIAYSLQQVEHDFGGAQGDKIVILVTDGKEECKGHPSAVVSEMLAKGFRVRLHIVGFALGDEADKREMRQLAERTGGRFFDAQDAKDLHGAIEQALAVHYEQALAVPYDVLDAAGSRVASGLTGQGAIAVPEGVYTVVVHAAGQPITIADVHVAHDQFTRVELKKEGQEVGMQVLGPVQKNGAPWAVEAATAPPSLRHR